MNIEAKIRDSHLPPLINTAIQFGYSVVRAFPPGKSTTTGGWDAVPNEDFDRVVSRLGNFNDPERQIIRNSLVKYNTQSILDLGCGSATEHESYRSDNRLGTIRYVGYDESQRMLAIAKNRISTGNISDFLVRGDIHTLPFSDNSFDAVLLKHILEHQSDGYQTSLSEAIRVAKKCVLVNFFHTPLGLNIPDIHLTDRRGFANNWYSRKKFEDYIRTKGKVDSFEVIKCVGVAGQIADIYIIKLID